jgi:hypothetical protein
VGLVGGSSELNDQTTIGLRPTTSGNDGDLHDAEKVVKESGDFGALSSSTVQFPH